MTGTRLSLEREALLIECAQNGDGEAFGEIYDAYRQILYATILFPRLRDEKAAEDALQETFVLALRKLESYRFEGKSILLWLKTIAVFKARERQAKNRRVTYINDESLLDALSDREEANPETLAAAKDWKNELLGRIDACLGGVNERYREALRLRLVDKKSRAECAEILDVTVENFDIIFFRACRAFRKVYDGLYGA